MVPKTSPSAVLDDGRKVNDDPISFDTPLTNFLIIASVMSVSLMAIAGAVIVTTYCRVEIGLLNTNMMIPGSTGKTNLDEFAASFYSTFFESATCVEGCPRYFL